MTQKVYLRRSEHLIVVSVGRLRYLSSFQLDRLLYGTSLSHVQAACSNLLKVGLLDKLELPRYSQGGRNRRIYYLTQAGVNYLKDFDLPCRRSRDKPTYQTLLHSLAINDVLIAAHKLKGYTLAEFTTEFEWKSKPTGGLAPDASILFERDGSYFPIVVEVDRSTEQRKFFKDKVSRLVRYSQDHESLTIAVIDITDNPNRLKALIRWTEQELTELGARNLKDIFLFASFDTDQEELSRVFCEAIWHTPFGEEPTTLLSPATI